MDWLTGKSESPLGTSTRINRFFWADFPFTNPHRHLPPSVSFKEGIPLAGSLGVGVIGVMGVEGHDEARVLPPVRSPLGRASAMAATFSTTFLGGGPGGHGSSAPIKYGDNRDFVGFYSHEISMNRGCHIILKDVITNWLRFRIQASRFLGSMTRVFYDLGVKDSLLRKCFNLNRYNI